MAKLNVIIADTDELYSNNLANYFMEKASQFEISIFTKTESLLRYIEAGNAIDILLTEEGFLLQEVKKASIGLILILADGEGVFEGISCIKKYQRTESLLKDILVKHAEHTGKTEAIKGERNTRFVGFYSPCGGSGKTTMALATAALCAAQGKKTFYLNLEKVNSTGWLFPQSPGSMSDVFFALKTQGMKAGVKILASRAQHAQSDIHYISGVESISEYMEITSGDLLELIEEFEKLGEYDFIMIDFGSEINKEKIEILQQCDHIFVPVNFNFPSFYKIKTLFKEDELHDQYTQLIDKMHLIVNKADSKEVEESMMQSEILDKYAIAVMLGVSPIFMNWKTMLSSSSVLRTAFEPVLSIIYQK